VLPLFEDPNAFDRDGLRRKLAALTRDNVWIGTSSWKYEGWLGQIYDPERYRARGRFSQKRFEAECLREYAETFPIVCGDFSFYQFPTPEFWQKLFGSAPATLRYAFKVPEEITVKLFPVHPRYGPRAGERNQSFLNPALFEAAFLELLRPYRSQIAVLIFEFGTFSKTCYQNVQEFLEQLEPFLAVLPADFRYAVEIRNEEFLCHDYFECLRRHEVAHVLNAWTRMPRIADQMHLPGVFTAGFTVVRALLRQGRPYADAVATFSPYKSIQEPNPESRQALRHLIARARDERQPSYIFVNNRFEGNAPGTIEAIID
jgi:uncharacterized protein YecE (DUF72 family)